MREGQALDSPVVTKLPAGTQVRVRAISDNRAHVHFDYGQSEPPVEFIDTQGWVSLRAKAGTQILKLVGSAAAGGSSGSDKVTHQSGRSKNLPRIPLQSLGCVFCDRATGLLTLWLFGLLRSLAFAACVICKCIASGFSLAPAGVEAHHYFERADCRGHH